MLKVIRYKNEIPHTNKNIKTLIKTYILNVSTKVLNRIIFVFSVSLLTSLIDIINKELGAKVVTKIILLNK
jgi:hypothetical protein